MDCSVRAIGGVVKRKQSEFVSKVISPSSVDP